MDFRDATLCRRSSRDPAVGFSILLALGVALTACDRGGNPLAATLPSSVVIVSGSGQSAAASTAPAQNPTVRVTGVSGNTLSGVTVTWEVTDGGGGVSPATSVTDGQGQATTTWTFGPAAEPQGLTATVQGLAPVTFTGTATGG